MQMQDQDWTEVRKKPAVAKPKPLAQSNASLPTNAWSGQANRCPAVVKAAKPATNSQRTSDYNKRALDKDDGNYAGLCLSPSCS